MANAMVDGYLFYLNEFENIDYLQEGVFDNIKGKIISNLDKLNSNTKSNIKTMEGTLKKYGLNVAEMKRDINKKFLKYKNDKDLKRIQNKESLKKTMGDIRAYYKTKIEEIKEEKELSEKILMSLRILMQVLILSISISIIIGTILSYMTAAILSQSIGVLVGEFFSGVIVAPLVEELGKKVAINLKIPWLYTGIFSAVEFFMYVVWMLFMGMSLPLIVLKRSFAVLLHFSTTYIQKKISESDDINMNNKEKQKLGYRVAVGVHALFNAVAMIIELV